MNLDELRDRVNAQVGQSLIKNMAPDDSQPRVRSGLSSGSLSLNLALSGDPFIGYAWGRIIELYGPEGSGKTTLMLHAIHEAQKLDVPALYIDAENALDPDYAEAIGIDMSRFDLSQPDSGEQALDLALKAVENGYKLIVVDSVAALAPKAELEGDIGDAHVGLQARMMAQGLRKIAGALNKQQAILLFVNQIRMNIGVMFGNPETTPGGKALKFYASYRIEVRSPRKGAKKGKTLSAFGREEQQETSTAINAKTVKNKLYPPFRTASFRINYGEGIDKIDDVITVLDTAGAFEGKGLHLTCKGKEYSDRGLRAVIYEPEVQAELVDIIKRLTEVGE